jgi:hypothetical protein
VATTSGTRAVAGWREMAAAEAQDDRALAVEAVVAAEVAAERCARVAGKAGTRAEESLGLPGQA